MDVGSDFISLYVENESVVDVVFVFLEKCNIVVGMVLWVEMFVEIIWKYVFCFDFIILFGIVIGVKG